MKTMEEAKKTVVVGEQFEAPTGIVWEWLPEKSEHNKYQAKMVTGCSKCGQPGRIAEASDVHQVTRCATCHPSKKKSASKAVPAPDAATKTKLENIIKFMKSQTPPMPISKSIEEEAKRLGITI